MEVLYDNIVSLGYNCEVSFRIKDYKKSAIDSYVYSWAYICDEDLFLNSLDNIDDILNGSITLLPWGMFKCDKYELSFHTICNKYRLFDADNNLIQENVDRAKDELISRTNHLKNKFNELLKSDKKTLFVMKIRKKDNIIGYVQKVYTTLNNKYISGEFTLLVVIEEDTYNEEWKSLESEKLKIRTIKSYAPDSDTEYGGDIDGWMRVLSEFNLKKETSVKMNNLKKFLSEHDVEHILKENLKNFFNLEGDYNLGDLKKKYIEEEINELNRPIEYFENSINDIKNNIDKYIFVYDNLLNEEISKEVFVNMLYAKVFMSLKYVDNAYSNELMYYDKRVWGELVGETYIDCGGYNGDTALQFISNCVDYNKIFVYEPLKELNDLCRSNLQYFIDEGDLKVENLAIYKFKDELRFSKEAGKGDSFINNDGELIVKSTSLDEEINERITFIKMDIEGAEKDAILGAKEHIKNETPKMAICIYHLVDDYWKIPELINSINNNYNFIVRQHQIDGFSETVLYCVPKIQKKNDKIEIAEDLKYLRRYMEASQKLESYNKNQYNIMAELIKNRSWFLAQLRNYIRTLDNEKKYILELQEWNSQILEGKEFWEEQANNYKHRASESEKLIDNLRDKIHELEENVRMIENNNSKLKYKLNSITNDPIVKKIIRWKKYDI